MPCKLIIEAMTFRVGAIPYLTILLCQNSKKGRMYASIIETSRSEFIPTYSLDVIESTTMYNGFLNCML